MFQALMKGGWMMLPLAVCSLVSVTIIIERFLFFRRIRGNTAPKKCLPSSVNKGPMRRSPSPTRQRCPIMRVLRTGLTHAPEPSGAMESAGLPSSPSCGGASRPSTPSSLFHPF